MSLKAIYLRENTSNQEAMSGLVADHEISLITPNLAMACEQLVVVRQGKEENLAFLRQTSCREFIKKLQLQLICSRIASCTMSALHRRCLEDSVQKNNHCFAPVLASTLQAVALLGLALVVAKSHVQNLGQDFLLMNYFSWNKFAFYEHSGIFCTKPITQPTTNGFPNAIIKLFFWF